VDNRTELGWFKSSKSSGGNCVEVAKDGDQVRMRHSKDPSGAVLAFGLDEFRAFVADLSEGELIPIDDAEASR
jgi:hypothetical protein